MTTKKAEPKVLKKSTASYTSIYLDKESRDGLTRLVEASGGRKSRSQVISGLILQACQDDAQLRIKELVAELSTLVEGS